MMSKGRLAGLMAEMEDKSAASPPPAAVEPARGKRQPGREGKKAIVGYFSLRACRELHQLALDNDVTIQGLLGEALDDLMRKYGRHPFGER